MKIGIDLHGVAFACPEFFSTIGRLLVEAGHEVHVITGSQYSERLAEEMMERGLIKGESFTHFFSIADYHIELGSGVWFDERGEPWLDDELWNRTKADYCKRENILVHFDDQQDYLSQFKTAACLFKQPVFERKNDFL